jgi:putative salt-induced outer membrane protein
MKTVRTILLTSLWLVSSASAADTIPTETTKAKTATSGATVVAPGGFVTGTTLNEDDPRQATELAISAGGLFSSGNAKTIALTSAAKFRLRRDEHLFTTALAGNFARAGKPGTAVDTTVENVQGLLRYDYFLNSKLSLFLQSTARHDRFQGLDLRVDADPGLAYYLFDTKKHRLTTELGYDFQHDVRRDEARIQVAPEGAAPGTVLPLLDKTQTLHNIRAFAGYENKLYKGVSINLSVEYLQSLKDIGVYRLIFDTGLKTQLVGKLAIATTYTMRFENRPLPSVEKADSLASVNLVYNLL